MEAENSSQRSRLILTKCADRDLQKFELTSTKEIKLIHTHEYCVTVGDGEFQKGGVGIPAHLMRRLTLENCATTKNEYKRWRIGN
mgnify:CR=1 FL=1